MLGEEAAARILEAPIEGQDHRAIYRALTIAAETEKLLIAAEGMVRKILVVKPEYYNAAYRMQFYLYLQINEGASVSSENMANGSG